MEVGLVLRRHAALARLGIEAMDRIVRASTLVRLRRGETLWQAGQSATAFAVVAVGLVKVMVPGGASRDLVLGLAGPGEGVGECAVLTDGLHDVDAYAFTESVVIARVPAEPFLSAMEQSGVAALGMARMFGESSRVANRRLALFTSSSEERLAAALTELGERFGDEMENGSTLIPLRLTRAELAALVGTTVETTIRTLSRWSREGLVSTEDGMLTLHDARALALRSVAPSVPSRRGLEAASAG